MNRSLTICSRTRNPRIQTGPLTGVAHFLAPFLFVFTLGTFAPYESARAGIETLESGPSGQKGRMRIRSDEFGAFGNCNGGVATFIPDSGTLSRGWMCQNNFLLTDGKDFQWLSDETLWQHEFNARGDRHVFVPGLSDNDVVSDTINETKTARTSKFRMDLVGVEVDLMQETPSSGYNVVQTYTFTNTRTEHRSLKGVWFSDPDVEFEQTPFDNRVGFVAGNVPRAYFIEESDVAGSGNPGIDDRDRRISVAAKMGDGITFDGYVGTKSPFAATSLHRYLEDNSGILEKDLYTIQEMDLGQSEDDVALTGVNLDTDGDCLLDSPGDVGAAMQFSLDIPGGGSATLALDYIGGSLSHALADFIGKPLACGDELLGVDDLDRLLSAIRAGQHDLAFDFTGDMLVDVSDLREFVTSPAKLHTYFGDANLDGEFSSGDFVAVFTAGQYEDGIPLNSTWGTGDWNADAEFDTGDFVFAFQEGGYEKGPRAAVGAVPEPSSVSLGMVAAILVAWLRPVSSIRSMRKSPREKCGCVAAIR